jgi:hypothetical protein
MVTVGNDSKREVLSKGTYHGHTIDDNGDKINIKLLDVLHLPELTVNFFSYKSCIPIRSFLCGISSSISVEN